MNRHHKFSSGFTLIELMITLLIVAILGTVATTVYSNYTLRNARVGVQTYMSSIAGKQEQYMLDARAYTTSASTLGLSAPSWLSAKYSVVITVNNAATPPTWLVTATPIGGQVKDTDCLVMSLASTGAKTATGSRGVSGCW